MQVLILAQAPHLIVSYRNQVVWGIPEELMKRVSQSRFQVTMLLGLDFVNRSPGRYERHYGAGIGGFLLIALPSENQSAFLKAHPVDNTTCQA
jgi:hypothetical protein